MTLVRPRLVISTEATPRLLAGPRAAVAGLLLLAGGAVVAGLPLAGCADAVPPTVASVTVPVASGEPCAASADRALASADKLAADDPVEALLRLDDALASCPAARGVADRRRGLEEALAASPPSLAAHVEQGWARREAGDTEGARRAFSWVIRAGSATGHALRPLPLLALGDGERSDSTRSASRLDERTLLLGGSFLDSPGAVVMRYRRVGGEVRARPVRFLVGNGPAIGAGDAQGVRIISGGGGHFAVVSPSITRLFPGPEAAGIGRPGGDSAAFADQGAALVVVRKGRVLVFDAETGARRGMMSDVTMATPRELTVVRERPWVARCPVLGDDDDAFVVDARTGSLLARSPRAASCALDVARERMVTMRLSPTPAGRSSVQVELLSTSGGAPRSVGLGDVDSGEPASLSLDPLDGEVTVAAQRAGKPVTLRVPPPTSAARATRRPATRQHPEPFGDIPIGESDFVVPNRSLRSLARPPRKILPNEGAPHLSAWTSNGARSPDRRWVAVVDRDPGPDGPDEQLLLADTATGAVRHRVALTRSDQRWLQVSFLDDRLVTVRQDWLTHVIDVPSGTLRALVDVEATVRRTQVVLGDDLLALGDSLLDLARPRSPGEAARATVELPMASDLRVERQEGQIRLLDPTDKVWLTLHDDLTIELSSEKAPAWLHCAIGEWVLPFEACAHSLKVRAGAR